MSGTRFTIPISPDIIDQAVQRNSSHCMIAEAIKKAIPTAKLVSVDLQTIRWTDKTKGKRYICLTPRSAQLALVDFDQGKRPELTEVRLTPSQIVKVRKQKPRTDEQPKREKARLVNRRGNEIATKVGGAAPPLGALPGGQVNSQIPLSRRRSFGLRALER